MKVHFVGAVDGNKADYARIINIIEDEGWDIITKHSLERETSDLETETGEEAERYAKKMVQWIKKADVIVVEATKAVLGAGFEIATALNMNKPVVALYRPEKGETPHVLRGIKSEKLQVISYTDYTLKDSIRQSLDFAVNTQDTRFNFFISPKHQNYLDWIAKNRRIPRSVFLRRLIENHMDENEDYQA